MPCVLRGIQGYAHSTGAVRFACSVTGQPVMPGMFRHVRLVTPPAHARGIHARRPRTHARGRAHGIHARAHATGSSTTCYTSVVPVQSKPQNRDSRKSRWRHGGAGCRSGWCFGPGTTDHPVGNARARGAAPGTPPHGSIPRRARTNAHGRPGEAPSSLPERFPVLEAGTHPQTLSEAPWRLTGVQA